jgi:hypothetical protein
VVARWPVRRLHLARCPNSGVMASNTWACGYSGARRLCCCSAHLLLWWTVTLNIECCAKSQFVPNRAPRAEKPGASGSPIHRVASSVTIFGLRAAGRQGCCCCCSRRLGDEAPTLQNRRRGGMHDREPDLWPYLRRSRPVSARLGGPIVLCDRRREFFRREVRFVAMVSDSLVRVDRGAQRQEG